MRDCALEMHPLVNFYAIKISSVLRTSSYEPLTECFLVNTIFRIVFFQHINVTYNIIDFLFQLQKKERSNWEAM